MTELTENLRELCQEQREVLDDGEPWVYRYEEIDHSRGGMLVPCRNCGTNVFLKHVASMGCHSCYVERRPVVLLPKEETDD